MGYVKNTFVGFNLRQIPDIIDYADLYKIGGGGGGGGGVNNNLIKEYSS